MLINIFAFIGMVLSAILIIAAINGNIKIEINIKNENDQGEQD